MLKENGFVAALGNAFDGISLFGPFDTPEEAKAWAEAEAHRGDSVDWNVMALLEPEETEDD